MLPGPRKRVWIGVAILLVVGSVAFAQQQRRFGFAGVRYPFQALPNGKYDGRFSFVRIAYETAQGGYWYR